MGLNLWMKDDIANVIRGIALATPHMGIERTPTEAAAFQEGYLAALSAVAVSLGIVGAPERLPRVRMVNNPTHFMEVIR
jgi:hypothetical protein